MKRRGKLDHDIQFCDTSRLANRGESYTNFADPVGEKVHKNRSRGKTSPKHVKRGIDPSYKITNNETRNMYPIRLS